MTYNGSTVKAGLGQPTEEFQTRGLAGIRLNGVSQSLERDQKADMTACVSFGKIVCNFSESKAFGPLLHKTMSLLDSHHFYAAKPGVANTLCIRRQGKILLPSLILGIPVGVKQNKRGWGWGGPCQLTPALFWWFNSNPAG